MRNGLGEIQALDVYFTTPDEFNAFIREINVAVQALAHDVADHDAFIRAQADGGSFLRNWANFKTEWYHYYATWSSALGSAVGSTSVANEYANRYNGFEQQYHQLTGLTPTTPNAPGPRPTSTPWQPYAIGGMVIVGLGVVGYGLAQVARIYRTAKA